MRSSVFYTVARNQLAQVKLDENLLAFYTDYIYIAIKLTLRVFIHKVAVAIYSSPPCYEEAHFPKAVGR